MTSTDLTSRAQEPTATNDTNATPQTTPEATTAGSATVQDPSRVTVPLRWRDLDAQGHVYNGAYLTLFDEARSVYIRHVTGTGPEVGSVVARIEIDYVSEIAAGVPAVTIESGILAVGNKSFRTLETMYTPDGTVAARVQAVMLLWDKEARVALPLTDAQRAGLEAARVEQPNA
ncbi:acyl-CoA thioesterase [Brevibacterium samyangense]